MSSQTKKAAPVARPLWRLAGALVAGIMLTQSAVTSATVPSLISQDPLFARPAVPPNVMLMMDDSSSMARYTMPGIWLPNIQYRIQNNWPGWGNNWMTIGLHWPEMGYNVTWVNRDEELLHRMASLNALYYNPAITYKPWSDDGRTTFPNAPYGGGGTTPDWSNITPRDMRFLPGTRTPITPQAGYGSIPWWGRTFNAGGNIYHYQGVPGAQRDGYDLFTRPPPEPIMGCNPATYVAPVCQGGNVQDPVYGPPYCVATPADPLADPPRPAGQDCTRRDVVSYTTRYDSCATTTGGFCEQIQTGTRTFYVEGRYYTGDRSLSWAATTTTDPLVIKQVEIDRAKSRDYSDPKNRYIPVDPNNLLEIIKRPDCTTSGDGTWCTFEEEAQNYANWYTYYRTRLFSAIAVSSQALTQLTAPFDGTRMGYGRINYFPESLNAFNPNATNGPLPNLDGQPNPGAVVRGVRPFTQGSAARREVFDWLFSVNAVGATPNREATNAVGTYFTRTDDLGPWADAPGVGGGRARGAHLACRRNYHLLVTDGGWTNATTSQPRMESTPDSAFPLATPPSTARTADQVNGPIITGDGPNAGATYQWNQTVEAAFWQDAYRAQSDTFADVATFYFNRDLRPDLPNTLTPTKANRAFWQHMNNIVVGYGLNTYLDSTMFRQYIVDNQPIIPWDQVNMDPTLVPDGGELGYRTQDTFRGAMASRGDFFSATNPERLATALRRAMSIVKETTSSGTAIAGPKATVEAGDRLYAARFTTEKWVGELAAYDSMAVAAAAAAGQSMPAPIWVAQTPRDGAFNWTTFMWDYRTIWTSSAKNSAVPFRSSDLPASIMSLMGETPDRQSTNVSWIRGTTWYEGPAYGNRVRRDGILGDIVNSTPLYSKALDQGYAAGPAAGGGASYRAFVQASATTRPATIFVGANDGFFHAYNADTGAERWAYVPRAVHANLAQLPRDTYVHRYYVDGPTIQGDAHLGGQWKTIVLGSTGAGGRGLFAIDATDPTTIDAQKVLWDITGEDVPDLGHTISAGVIGSAKNGKWVAVVPNGYESATERAVLLVLDLETGNVIRKIDTNVGSATNRNGLGSVTPVFDRNRNIVGIYAGDKLGNIWKFDLSDANPSNWKIATPSNAPLFTAPQVAGKPLAITAPPRVTLHPSGGYMITFGTGKMFEINDEVSTQEQSLFGLWERGDALGQQIPASSIQTLAWTGSGASRTLPTSSVNWGTQRGWRAPLTTVGERVIAPPSINGASILLTSFSPNMDDPDCERAGGASTMYFIDVGGGDSAAIRAGAGAVGGLLQVQQLAPPATTRNRLDRSELNVMAPGRFSGGDTAGGASSGRATGVQTMGRAACVQAGVRIDGALTTTTRECAPLMPLRTYRRVSP